MNLLQIQSNTNSDSQKEILGRETLLLEEIKQVKNKLEELSNKLNLYTLLTV